MSFSPKEAHMNAWKHFYPQGNGTALNGHILHHIDYLMKYKNPKRYNQWRVEDLVMLTEVEHHRIHRKLESTTQDYPISGGVYDLMYWLYCC